MTGQPVNSVVTTDASLPAPAALASSGGQNFRAPEKRIHNQAELDRHVALPRPHAVLLSEHSFGVEVITWLLD